MSPTEQPPAGYDDEIDLRDLALMLVEGWYWIVGAVAVAVVAAFAYLAVTTPTYETNFRAVPASQANFSGFNIRFMDEMIPDVEGVLGNLQASSRQGFKVEPEDIYRRLGNRLSSFQNFEAFVGNNRDLFQLGEGADLGRVFNGRLSVSGLTAERDGSMTLNVQYRYPQGEQGSEILNAYVQQTAESVWNTLRSRFNSYNSAQITSLETQLDLQKGSLQAEREEQLFLLEQAITVARRLEIEKPTTPQQFGRQPSGAEVIYANISGDGSLPLYFMGYQALEADRDVLRDAIDQGLSNEEIRRTEQQLEQRLRFAQLLDNSQLQGVDVGLASNHTERVVDVVEYAFPPAGPSEPRRALILALSLVLGGMLGVMLVFLSRFAGSLRSYRKAQASARDSSTPG
ncbi:LPS O-antigen subunit length determinant protein (WzzB/FepE family) [Halomonas campaniensis]|uniref:LPS O-antigen subunit length determinant protein (WzzB/FepE family) n=1 Tax=Halomonas campaniensis TaxID=213554 RepID=A0A7W5K5X3_9GAMM|nr:Wzz/FepE/Etk N-terminal domain-containing protein [Halomonas campaniensis]MBB3332566.1 LPS O-antigen subunit length determinant protein (WzzB/FepE family) [Halomonas campaniensis]